MLDKGTPERCCGTCATWKPYKDKRLADYGKCANKKAKHLLENEFMALEPHKSMVCEYHTPKEAVR
jgi:hypothetical protein